MSFGLWLSVVTPCGLVGSGDVLEEHDSASLWNCGYPVPDDTVSAHKNTVWMPPCGSTTGLARGSTIYFKKNPSKETVSHPGISWVLKEVAQVVDCTGIYIRPLLWSLQGFCLSEALQQSLALNDHLPLLQSVEEFQWPHINTRVYFSVHYVNSLWS
jgi:hypothetical protein